MDTSQAQALANLGAVVTAPQDWQRRRYEAIKRCRETGLSYGDIGAVLGVSRQAVAQFVQSFEQGGKGK